MTRFAELREMLGNERLKYTFPWFIHPPLKNAEYPDDFLATGNPDDDSDNYNLLEYYEEAMPLIVAAVNALPELLQLEDENAALRREVSEVEAKGYRRGIDAVAQHYQQQANGFRRQAKQTPDVNRAESLEYRAMRFERHVEEIRKKFLAAPDTEGESSDNV